MMENSDDLPDSKKTYGIFTDNISDQRSLFSSPSTLGFFYYWNAGRTVQNVAMAGILDRPSIRLSCW